MDETTVNELVFQAIAGDHDAYVKIYDITKDYVYRTVHFLLIDKSNVDDVVQEIYFNLYKSLAKFDTSMPFRPWLTGIIMNKVRDSRRNNWKLTRILERFLSSKQSLVHDPIESIEERDLYAQLLDQIEKLSPKLKDVILLKYVHDFSQEEIAKILRIPIGTVKSRINSALMKLRNTDNKLAYTTLKEGTIDEF